MEILAIDPGDVNSAYVVWNGNNIIHTEWTLNKDVKEFVKLNTLPVVIEMIASYGMPVGRTVFETCLFIGQIMQVCEDKGVPCKLVFRKDIKVHLCHSVKAKDSNVRQALVDRFGDKGTKKNPGITYNLSKDKWAAFALSVYTYDNELFVA